MPAPSRSGGMLYQQLIKAKTASYTVTVEESGVLFTNRGATAAITFTLPLNSTCPIGTWFEFYGVSATGFTVASNPADTIVTKNDAAADSITMTTTSLMIGAAVKFVWDGTAWLSYNQSSGPTYTVAT